MLIWFAALAVAGVALVFKDPRLDHRLVALGAVLPIPLDLAIGAARGTLGDAGPFHAVAVQVFLLAAVMAITVGRKRLRKQLLAVIIGGFAHLVLDASFVDNGAFLWPIGTANPGRLQLVQRGPIIGLILEGIGLLVARWIVVRGQLQVSTERDGFVRSGRLELVMPPRRSRRRV
jgi:hypothetical protein